MVLTLGGDHSIAIGTIAGTSKAVRERLGREMAVIWVDAHADINTPETSDSGNIHGMPVAFLTGLAKGDGEEMFGWVKESGPKGGEVANGTAKAAADGFRPLLSLKKLVYIGLRDVDRGEKRILREHGIKAFSMHDIDRYVASLLLLPISPPTSNTFPPLPNQSRHRARYGDGSCPHRHRHAHPPLLRRRCS